MAEVIGAVASVLALCTTALQGIKLVREVYKKPKEMKNLQVSNVAVGGDSVNNLPCYRRRSNASKLLSAV